MIAFLIFYFVFSAIFMVGVRGYDQDSLPFSDCMICLLLGWFLMPFGLGILFARINNNELIVKIKKDE